MKQVQARECGPLSTSNVPLGLLTSPLPLWLNWQTGQIRDCITFKLALAAALNNLATKGKRAPSTQDTQGATAQQTYTPQQLYDLAMQLGDKEDADSARDLSMLLYLFASAARGDSIRLVHLADFCHPKHLKAISMPGLRIQC